eukprot:1146458-Pelagomonas_calceolata.AAC.2
MGLNAISPSLSWLACRGRLSTEHVPGPFSLGKYNLSRSASKESTSAGTPQVPSQFGVLLEGGRCQVYPFCHHPALRASRNSSQGFDKQDISYAWGLQELLRFGQAKHFAPGNE